MSRLLFSASRPKPFPKLNGSTHGFGAPPAPARAPLDCYQKQCLVVERAECAKPFKTEAALGS
jgi:hypothetical protein